VINTRIPKRNDILASKTTGKEEEKVPISKVWVGLAPTPNLKAVRPNIESGSNMRHKPVKDYVKLYNQKLDFCKTQTKVNTWTKPIWVTQFS
jgi:hypothetical protein